MQNICIKGVRKTKQEKWTLTQVIRVRSGSLDHTTSPITKIKPVRDVKECLISPLSAVPWKSILPVLELE